MEEADGALISQLEEAEGTADCDDPDLMAAIAMRTEEAEASGLYVMEEQVQACIARLMSAEGEVPEEREQDLESKVVSFVEGILDPSCPPRTTVTVVVQILSEDGSLLATILNATAMALVEAGVPLFGSPVAVSIAVADSGTPRVRLDPDLREESTCELVGTYAYLFVTEGDQTGASVVQASSMGRSSAETAMLALATAEKAAEAVFHSRRGGEE